MWNVSLTLVGNHKYTNTKLTMKKINQFVKVIIILLLASCEKNNISTELEANFSDSYISQHQDKYFIEIPEVYELANIIMAVKYQNSNNDYFIEKNTSYFKTVIDNFNPYKTTELFKQFNYSETDFLNNYSFRENSYRCIFSEGQIISDNIYLKETWSPNIFEKHIDHIQAFSEESNFQVFYNENNEFYASQIALYDSLIPLRHMWDWLETNFTSKINCYKIIISPLTTGSHSTQQYESNEYKETLMFVQGFNREIDSFDSINIAINIRYVFTEIDHNYVNSVTDKYRNELNKSMADLNSWRKKNQMNEMYNDAYKIFNEYLTWAIYDLYISEFYLPNTYDKIQNTTVSFMENQRGFIKFREFEKYLVNLYNNRADNERLENLYPQILEWISKNN